MGAKGPYLPKFDKQRREKPPDRPVQKKHAQEEPHKAGDPQLPATDPEGQHQHPVVKGQQEAAVGKRGVLWPQGPQEAIPEPQPQADAHSGQKKFQGLPWGNHPSSRFSQPPPAAS